MDPRARQLIDRLQLQPHPEGGFYREIFRSAATVRPDDDRPPRAALTTIYFLLAEGQHSRWHRVRSDEVWHAYDGDGLELFQAPPDLASVECLALGPPDGVVGPVHTVPAGWWQAARPRGAFSLVGCTVGPGFEFDDFSFLRDEAALVERLTAQAPELRVLV
ncbi:MAG: cupin domain-containing protein [Acidobacteriota bacterium]|nr:cupin domain-containing protein [Acidobacteriota bacterium]